MDHTRETCMCERSRSSRFHVDKHVLDHADLIHHFSRNDLDHADPIDPPPQNVKSRGSFNNINKWMFFLSKLIKKKI